MSYCIIYFTRWINRQLLPYANLVVGNEEEFRTLAHGDHPTADLGRAIASSPYLPTGHKNSCQIADYLLGKRSWSGCIYFSSV